MPISVSVVFPIHGAYDKRRLRLAIESVRQQKLVSVEIVVSEANALPSFQSEAQKTNIKYVFTEERDGVFNSGRTRNAAIKKAAGQYLYLNDSDIVFMRTRYLQNLILLMHERQPALLDFPPMKRLVCSQFDGFYRTVQRNGLAAQLRHLAFPDGFTSEANPREKLLRFRFGSRNKLCTLSLSEYNALTDEERKSIPQYWFGLLYFTRHPGAIFAERELVLASGGYCEDFTGWGSEDVDLKFKLLRMQSMKKYKDILIPRAKKFEVLHLDHTRRFIRERWEINNLIHQKRMKTPVEALVSHDRRASGM